MSEQPMGSLGDTGSGTDTGTGTPSTTDAPEPSVVEQLQGNPAWGEIFDKLPGGYRDMIAPTLQKWDKGFQDVQTRYNRFKEFDEAGYTPEQIKEAMGLRDLAQQNPRQIYDLLIQAFGEEWGINPGQPEQQPQAPQQPQVTDLGQQQQTPQEFDITQHPKYQELAQKTDTVASYLAQQIQAEQAQQADEALNQEVAGLKQKYGDWDEKAEQVIFSMAQANPEMPLEAAVLQYKALEESIRSRPSPGAQIPRIMPTGGGIPSGQVDVASLSGKDTRGLVQQYLKAARDQG